MADNYKPGKRLVWTPAAVAVLRRFLDKLGQMNSGTTTTAFIKSSPSTLADLKIELELVREEGCQPLTEDQIWGKIRCEMRVQQGQRERHNKSGLLRATTKRRSQSLNKQSLLCSEANNAKMDTRVVMLDNAPDLPVLNDPARRLTSSYIMSSIHEANTGADIRVPGTNDTRFDTATAYQYNAHDEIEMHHVEGVIPWQEGLYSSWQNYLQKFGDDFARSHEQSDHDKIRGDIEDILESIKSACEPLLSLLPDCHMWTTTSDLRDDLMIVMTGDSGQSAINDLKWLYSCCSQLSNSDRCCILTGAAIYKWIFQDFNMPQHAVDTSDRVMQRLMRFMQKECPKVWDDYQELQKQSWLSSMTTPILKDRAVELTNHLFSLFEFIHFSVLRQCRSAMIHNDLEQKSISEMIEAKKSLHDIFLGNMTQAMLKALSLRKDLAKSTAVNYTFEFPKIKSEFDCKEMQIRNSRKTQVGEHQLIVATLFPSIWTSARRESDKPRVLHAKAMVML